MHEVDPNRDAGLKQVERLREFAEAVALMLSSTCFEKKAQGGVPEVGKDQGAVEAH